MSQFKETYLKNGLRVVADIIPGKTPCACGFFVKTGARDEQPEEVGISHFLEHMMFKGTEKRNAFAISEDFAKYGAMPNAYTSNENTVYYSGYLQEFQSEVVEILSNMMKPLLDPKEFDLERNVILEEIALYMDNPFHVMFNGAVKSYYGDNPLGNPILGTNDTISNMKCDQMVEYYMKKYKTSNITFVASGDIDWDSLIEVLERETLSLLGGEVHRVEEPYNFEAKQFEDKSSAVKRSYLCLLAPGISYQSEKHFASSILSYILGVGSNSRTYWEILDKGLADSAGISFDLMDGTGLLYAYASCGEDKIEKIEYILREILSKAAEVTVDELSCAKNMINSSMALSEESTMNRMVNLGTEILYNGQTKSLDDKISEVNSVTIDDIRELCQSLDLNSFFRYTLKPEQ